MERFGMSCTPGGEVPVRKNRPLVFIRVSICRVYSRAHQGTTFCGPEMPRPQIRGNDGPEGSQGSLATTHCSAIIAKSHGFSLRV